FRARRCRRAGPAAGRLPRFAGRRCPCALRAGAAARTMRRTRTALRAGNRTARGAATGQRTAGADMNAPLSTFSPEPRLTSLSHGGGCGCKIAPGVLSDLLKGSVPTAPFAQLLVGMETADDAAVYQLSEHQALVATTDFFMPIVDDPFDFGRIAAANALSDVYAMGGTPILALALLAVPVNVLSPQVIREI